MRTSKYDFSKNPLFSKEEAAYWNNLPFPEDEEFDRILSITREMDNHALYKSLGHERYNAFMLRWAEDDKSAYETYTETKDIPF